MRKLNSVIYFTKSREGTKIRRGYISSNTKISKRHFVSIFTGQELLRTKIVKDNKIIEQVNLLKYLRNLISNEGELDIDNKLNNFMKITGILNNVFRSQNLLRKQE